MSPQQPTTDAAAVSDDALRDVVYRKAMLRFMPLLCLCLVAAYLDRVNVGFAKLTMLDDLGFSNTVFGLGAGVFFLGYFLFEVPSNALLHRIGARAWIARIMITWGVIGALMPFVQTPTQFYILRFLLGVCKLRVKFLFHLRNAVLRLCDAVLGLSNAVLGLAGALVHLPFERVHQALILAGPSPAAQP